jgi:phosphotransferase system enzyme I (PtsP)
VPSILETLDELCAEADFFSIGSNDFVQYMLAADRGNEEVAEFHRPHHPAVLRALAKMVRTANNRHVPVSICGEMANQLIYLPFLLGIGLREFSVAPNKRDEISDWTRSIDLRYATDYAEMLLREPTLKGVETLLDQCRSQNARTCKESGYATAVPSAN